jgi:hypothetical protein
MALRILGSKQWASVTIPPSPVTTPVSPYSSRRKAFGGAAAERCAHELLPPEVGQVDLDFHRGGLVVARPVLGFERVGVAALAEFFCFGGEEA